jgi:hypothetical protein
MAFNVTLGSMKTQARQRADMENTTFISDSELGIYLNNSATELYDLLVQAYGEYYYKSESTISMVSGTFDYSLPSDFYKLIGLDLLISGTYNTASAQYAALMPLPVRERNKYQNISSTTVAGNYPNYRYRIFGDKVRFVQPSSSDTVVVLYVPRMPLLSTDGSNFDGINGWEEYVIVDAAIKMLDKEETSSAHLRDTKNMLMNRIKQLAANRDIGAPERVTDVNQSFSDDFLGGYYT